MNKRIIVSVGLTAVLITGLLFVIFQNGKEGRERIKASASAAVSMVPPVTSAPPVAAKGAVATNGSKGTSNIVGQVKVRPQTREFDINVNPYAAALQEPGKSKRVWDANFLKSLKNPQSGNPIRFELTEGRMASGTILMTQHGDGGELTYISGELSEPENGKFFFLKPPEGGRAGKAVGVIEFPASQTAYRIEPTGLNGEPELWQRRMDEVVCQSMPLREDGVAEADEIPPARPDLVPMIVPSYNSNIVSLQSYPGSPAVLLLDFFGGYTPTWGGAAYPKPNVNNLQIKDVWKRVAEDFMPFNINVTTDIQVYKNAPAASRQRCVFTPSTPAIGPGAAGVAYIGSWNWGNDTVCWSIYTTGKNGAEVGGHEPGHTLGLGHQGTSTQGYYGGHGTGSTAWSPIMGVGYYTPISSWAKGEYQDANNTQDELAVIDTFNAVSYRPDDTGSTLATARYLEIYPDFSAEAEGVIERTGDTDSFQFTTTGGQVFLKASPVGDWADLAVMAELADETGTVIASDNPQTVPSASISTMLPAGTYTLRVTGVGRNDPFSTGFTAYGSLGYYSIVGSVAGGRLPTRLGVTHLAPNGTVVGAVPANTTGDVLGYTIVSGNTGGAFSIDANGVVTVANSAQINYSQMASNTTRTVQFELFVNINNLSNPAQTELNRRVVIRVLNPAVSNPIEVTGFNASLIVPYNATLANKGATDFDLPNHYAFYQAGLNGNAQVSGSGGHQGLPVSGRVLSQVDNSVFQLGTYGSTNALMMGTPYPSVATLTLVNPQSYNSIAVLASSANGGGLGTMVITFTNGVQSQVFNFNAQDWFGASTNTAVQGIGRLQLSSGLSTQDNGADNPNMYQTTIDLASLGLNQPIASVRFTKPLSGTQNTAVFALSGVAMPAQVVISKQPLSSTNRVTGASSLFTAAAMGTGPLGYQWYSGTPASGTLLDGQTSTSLFVAPPEVNHVTNYFVVVTNATSAATSSVATLTVYRAPVIVQQPGPTNLFLMVGGKLNLFVSANASTPLNHYWTRDGAAVPGGTTSNLVVNNLQLGHTGNYSVLVSNAFGSVTSRVISVTVQVAPTNPFPQRVVVDHPAGYWRLDESPGTTVARDYIGGNNGVYNNVVLGQLGNNYLDTHTAAKFGPGLNIYVGGIPIDFGTATNANFSVEAWVKAGTQTTDAGIVTKGSGAGGEQFNLDTGAGSRAFRFFVRDSTGAAHLANGTVGPNNTWQHVVGVCDQLNGMVILYVNGISNASGTIPVGSGILSTTNLMTIGSRQSGASGTFNNQFNGLIEEVSVYNYALTPAQVQTHFNLATNRPPVFITDPFTLSSINAGQAISGTIATNATEPNAEAITYSKFSGPSWLNVAANGNLSGTPLSGDAGANSFVVRAADPGGAFDLATMNLTVIAPPPLIAGLSLQGSNAVLSWTGGVGPYQVQKSVNLESPVWEDFLLSATTNSLILSPSNTGAFYRIRGR